MREAHPLQLYQLMKTFFIIFFGLAVLLAIISAIFPTTLQAIKILMVITILVSLVGGYLYYKNRYHTYFSYDERGFILKEGKNEMRDEWKNFDTVSLVHEGYGTLSVRMYRGEDHTDIPASDLKLDPSQLRFEIIEFLKGEKRDE